MYLLFFFAGFFFGGKSLSFASITESHDPRLSGLAIGFANMLVMLNGVFSLPLVGKILDFTRRQGPLSMESYGPNSFRIALSPIPVGLALSLLLTVFIKETYPKDN